MQVGDRNLIKRVAKCIVLLANKEPGIVCCCVGDGLLLLLFLLLYQLLSCVQLTLFCLWLFFCCWLIQLLDTLAHEIYTMYIADSTRHLEHTWCTVDSAWSWAGSTACRTTVSAVLWNIIAPLPSAKSSCKIDCFYTFLCITLMHIGADTTSFMKRSLTLITSSMILHASYKLLTEVRKKRWNNFALVLFLSSSPPSPPFSYVHKSWLATVNDGLGANTLRQQLLHSIGSGVDGNQLYCPPPKEDEVMCCEVYEVHVLLW